MSIIVNRYGLPKREIAHLIFSNESNKADDSLIQRIVMPFHQNGTFFIGERANNPPYIRGEKNEGFLPWAREVTLQDLELLEMSKELSGISLSEGDRVLVADAVANSLTYSDVDGVPIADKIPNQNYIDYVRRSIGLLLFNDVNKEFDSEKEYNSLGRAVVLSVVEKLEKEKLENLMVYAILAGVIGLDIKCSFCAASTFDRKGSIWLGCYDSHDSAVEGVILDLRRRISQFDTLLFDWNKYHSLVLENPCMLTFFPDDIPETIFDLYQLQKQMLFNPQLRVQVIPRGGRFHNDASFEDTMGLLDEPIFSDLGRFMNEGRLVVSPHGPKNGGLDLTKLSREAAELVLASDVLYIKGSRSYELAATGIRIPTFFAQTVSREFSESVIGVDANKMLPALQYVHAFPGFWGFRNRNNNEGWTSDMTAIQSSRFIQSAPFARYADQYGGVDALSLRIMDRSIQEGIPPHLIELCIL